MDELDRRILQLLQEDGRTPFTQLAKKIGLSETAVRFRYKNLVEQGVVRTVSIVDPYALDFQAPALIHIAVEAGQLEAVARQVADLPETAYLIGTLGPYDLLAEVYCRNLKHLSELVTQRIQAIPGVRSTATSMVAQVYKLSYRWSPSPEET
ncbi:MAG: AsnC family transcriptional regulator [Anaerolineae bacterium]|nr:MAG: AsnC family transcriptional regulator [Anaerolineae bacterium]